MYFSIKELLSIRQGASKRTAKLCGQPNHASHTGILGCFQCLKQPWTLREDHILTLIVRIPLKRKKDEGLEKHDMREARPEPEFVTAKAQII